MVDSLVVVVNLRIVLEIEMVVSDESVCMIAGEIKRQTGRHKPYDLTYMLL